MDIVGIDQVGLGPISWKRCPDTSSRKPWPASTMTPRRDLLQRRRRGFGSVSETSNVVAGLCARLEAGRRPEGVGGNWLRSTRSADSDVPAAQPKLAGSGEAPQRPGLLPGPRDFLIGRTLLLQLPLQDLPGGGHRQRDPKLDGAGHLNAGEIVPAPPEDLLLRCGGGRPAQDVGLHLFARDVSSGTPTTATS